MPSKSQYGQLKQPSHYTPRLRLLAQALSCVAYTAAVGSAYAQDTAAPAPEVQRSLKTVEVTSFRLADFTVPVARIGSLGEQVVLDIPISINSFSRDLLERQQAVKLTEILRNDPSITNAPTAGSFPANFLGIRGYVGGADGFSYDGMGPGVPLFVLQSTLEATERFELIKGPASAIAGFAPFAAVGGSINLVPKKPGKEPITSLTLGWRDKSVARVAVDISRRLGQEQQFGLRVNAVTESGEPSVEQAKDKRRILAVAADWKLTEALSMEAGFNNYLVRNDAPQFALNLDPGVEVPSPGNARKNFYQPWAYLQTELTLATIGAAYTIAPGWKASLKMLSGTRKNEGIASAGATVLDSAGNNFYPLVYIAPGSIYKFNSTQAAVNGSFNLGSTKHALAFAVNQDRWRANEGLALIDFYDSNLNNPVYVPAPLLPNNIPISKTNESKSHGIFISDSIAWTDKLTTLIALRNSNISFRNFDTTGATTLDQTDKKLSPLVGVAYKPQQNWNIYANYSTGLVRGGQAPATAANAGEILPSSKAKQIELGMKYETPDGLALTSAYFDIGLPLEYTNASGNFVQTGRQRHKGLEFTASGNVTKQLSVVGGLMLINARQTGTGDATTDGKRALGVPAINLPLYASYQLPSLPGLSFSAGLQHFGKQYVNDTNTLTLPSWTRYDAGVRYVTQLLGKQTTMSLNIENLADRKYFSSAAEGQLALGTRRNLRLALRTDF